ncbi:MAG TPA: DUF3857 domain-containing protein [Verrucomicrobiae bacterium]|jgi:transglutaminase-like putative cysteine protease
MKLKTDFPVLCLVLLGLATWPAPAAETNDYAGPDWALVDTGKVLPAAAEITPEKFPNCDEATVEQKSVRFYRADGTGESQDESFTKVLTEKGRRDNRTLSLGYQLPYTTVAVPQLEIIKPNGAVVPVDVAANSKDSIDDSQMSANIYDPNTRVVRINIPKLEVGDMVHAVIRQTTERPLLPGEFADENVFEGSGYIRHITYEIHAPASRPLLRIALRDEVPGTVTYTVATNADTTLTYQWEIKDVPRMFDEANMPPYDMVLQRLFVSTTPDWQAISKWYWNLSQSHLAAVTPELKQKVFELTAGQTNDLDKIHALFYFVSKNIRYMGLTPEKDRPGFEPHDVSITFDRKYGVCRDKAALLVAMLENAGLNAFPVLINVGAKRDQEVPQPDFDHAIVAVELTKGEYVLMDPTDENTPDLLPSYDCNRSYLVCRAEGETLRTSPVPPVDEHLLRVQTTGVLSADGHLAAKSEIAFDGVNDDDYRNAFSHMKPDDERRFFERNLKAALPGATLISLKLSPENMLDTATKLHATLEFSVTGMLATGDGKAVVSLPWIGKTLGVVNFVLDGADLKKRKYPFQTEVTCGLTEHLSIKLSDEFTGQVAMPTATSVDDESLRYAQKVAFKNGSLVAMRELKLKTVEFSPAQYLQLKQTLKDMEYDARKNPILAMSGKSKSQPAVAQNSPAMPVASNAEVLESSKRLQVLDAHTAVYTVKYAKRILTYGGKIREAEVKVDYNPACEAAKLIRAVVISKTGERKEISPGEINVMDQGWNPSAKRYTGGKILVANLPGVEIGSTIEVEFSITSTNKLFLAGYESFQLPDALDKKSFVLTAPADVTVQKLLGGAKGLVSENRQTTNEVQAFTWAARDVPALPAETSQPPEWIGTPGVGYFIGDLKAHLRALNTAMLTHARNDTKAAAMAQQLTGSATNKLAAVKAIRDFIATSIRVAGPSFTDLPLSELSDADTTLGDGYGHMADRAILFYAMLNAAGFQPEFVLASDLPPISRIKDVAGSFPLPQYFELPLVRIRVGGETYYLNDTDQYSQLGTTSADENLGLVLASGKMETLHAAKECANRIATTYAVSLADDGKARITIGQSYYGDTYNSKNRYFSELPPEERDRYYQRIVSEVSQGAQPVGDLVTKFDTYPGHEEYTVDVDHYGVVDGKYFYFDVPSMGQLFGPGADHRTLPLYISHGIEGSVRTEVSLPAAFQTRVIEPKSEVLKAPGGTRVDIVRKDAKGHTIITDKFTVVPSIISPKEYPTLLDVESTLGKKSAGLFLLEQK